YVDNRLKAERLAYDVPLIERNGADQILVELDGCMIRTGQLVASEESGTTAVRHLPQRCRDEA
ncbi:MAG: preprotein translocase subunit SecD, partial [Myxococcota bacterium]